MLCCSSRRQALVDKYETITHNKAERTKTSAYSPLSRLSSGRHFFPMFTHSDCFTQISFSMQLRLENARHGGESKINNLSHVPNAVMMKGGRLRRFSDGAMSYLFCNQFLISSYTASSRSFSGRKWCLFW